MSSKKCSYAAPHDAHTWSYLKTTEHSDGSKSYETVEYSCSGVKG